MGDPRGQNAGYSHHRVTTKHHHVGGMLGEGDQQEGWASCAQKQKPPLSQGHVALVEQARHDDHDQTPAGGEGWLQGPCRTHAASYPAGSA